MQQELGVNVRLITRDELKELEPDWTVDEVELAAYEPDSGYGDGAGVANDFLSAARDLGVTYLPRTQATSFHVQGGHVRGVRTEQGDINAPIVIAATGPWTRPLFQQVGFDVPIEPEYHQVAILKNAPDMKGGGCACIDSVTSTYFRPDAHDKFLVGDFYGQRPVDPDNFPQRAADDSLEEIIERASRRIPKLENAEVMRGVTGVYDMTPDSRPLLGEIPGVDGTTPVRGIFRHGIQDFSRHWLGYGGVGARRRKQNSRPQFISARRGLRKVKPIRAEFEYQDEEGTPQRLS